MDFREFLASGKAIVGDTRARKIAQKGKALPPSSIESLTPAETDPYRIFAKRTVAEKPKKAEMVKDIKKFIEAAEALL